MISWPAFTTADSKPVAAGTKSVTLGSGGSLAVDLGAFALLGLAAQAVKEAGDVTEAKGVNIVLDQQLIADIKALIEAIEEYAKTVGLQKPVGAK